MLKPLLTVCACTLCFASSSLADDARIKIHVLDKDLKVIDGYNEKIIIKNGKNILDPTKNTYCFETEKKFERNQNIAHWCEYNTNSMNWGKTPVDTKHCWHADHKFGSSVNYCNDFIVDNKSSIYTVSRIVRNGYEANPNYTSIVTGKINGEKEIVFLPKGVDYIGSQVKSLPKPFVVNYSKNSIEVNVKPFNSTKYLNARGSVISGAKVQYSVKAINKKTKYTLARTSTSPKIRLALPKGEYNISYWVSAVTKQGKYIVGARQWSPTVTAYVEDAVDTVTPSVHLDRPPLISTYYTHQLTRFHDDNGEHIYIGLPSFKKIVYDGTSYDLLFYEVKVTNVKSGDESYITRYNIKSEGYSHIDLKSGHMIGVIVPGSIKKPVSIYKVQYRIGISTKDRKTIWTDFSDPGYIDLKSSSGSVFNSSTYAYAPHIVLPTPEVGFSAARTVFVKASKEKIYVDGKTSVEVKLMNTTTGKTTKSTFKLLGDNNYGKIYFGLSKPGVYKAQTILHHSTRGDSEWSGTTEFVIK